ncbi:MAG: hypothetical protein M3Z41_03795 [Candidatus Eremiobacteraeota bacterium]|nr:hypothetical protein [Candidatus Eremiobacteraeota bacterium]
MLQPQAQGQTQKTVAQKPEFDVQVKLFRTGVMVAMGLFAGTVLGGIVGLFVYANSRTPNAHDGVFAVIQILGVVLGLAMGYLAARSAEAQEQLFEASQRAGISMLKKYKPKPGGSGHANVGQRVIGSANAGEEFLKTLLDNNK